MRGRSAVDPRWIARPGVAAAGIGRGLRHLHDTLPVDACPFDWSVERRLLSARERAADSREFAFGESHLGTAPAIDRLVVCHGDACAPNTLLHDDGTFAAHVDLGSLGVADRWADLAVAAWSTEWNYGPGYDGIVYAAYGLPPDPMRIAYYRAIWNLT
jgi:kanamycin kinase